MSETTVTAGTVVSATPAKRRRRRATKAGKVRRALDKNMSVQDIVKKYDVTPQYVYRLRHEMRKQQRTGIASVMTTLPATQPGGIGSLPSTAPVQPAPAEAATDVAPAERPTLWQRFKLWAWGRA